MGSVVHVTCPHARLCSVRGALHRPAHPHHRQQLQQVLREVQDRGGDRAQEEPVLMG